MNIEKTISEQAVSDILTPMLESQDRIVTEDVAPLFNKATGLDTPPASGTVTTTIEESRSVITAIIRKAWTAPLTMLGGASVLSSIAAAYTYLRNRLQGNETYGIPDRRSEISESSPLAANLALLNDRKISVGDMPIADGASMQCLFLTDMANSITDVKDYMQGYTLTKDNHTRKIWFLLFPNMTRLEIGCKKIEGGWALSASTQYGDDCPATLVFPYLEEVNGGGIYYSSTSGSHSDTVFSRLTTLQFPRLKKCNGYLFCGGWGNGGNALTSAQFPALEEVSGGVLMGGWYSGSCNNLTELEFPELTTISGGIVVNATGGYGAGFTKLESLRAPKLTKAVGRLLAQDSNYSESPNGFRKLILVEIGQGLDTSLNLAGWYPRDVLADSSNLQQFLENFRDYIAKKLTDNGSGKTLTLSQAVFSEIWDSQGQPQVKGDGLDQLRADIHRIIRTEKQWAVNKA